MSRRSRLPAASGSLSGSGGTGFREGNLRFILPDNLVLRPCTNGCVPGSTRTLECFLSMSSECTSHDVYRSIEGADCCCLSFQSSETDPVG